MFTGIVKSIGVIKSVQEKNGGMELVIEANFSHSLETGQSALISGICSTVTRLDGQNPVFFYMTETLEKTTASQWQAGARVNIEPSLRIGDTMDGHFVFGHIDGKGHIERIEKSSDSWTFFLKAGKEIVDFFVPKASVALDGVSLTLIDVNEETFSVALTPFTLEHTTLGLQKEGQNVNIEVDMLAKYVENYARREGRIN